LHIETYVTLAVGIMSDLASCHTYREIKQMSLDYSEGTSEPESYRSNPTVGTPHVCDGLGDQSGAAESLPVALLLNIPEKRK
jgi:hypothetical protein